ncbi:helix-turn-helix transcriptional regulator [Comamonas sp. NoAH]|uniref:helix-turn-helix transcriptional regulator n=1 Tax=Comamonas halotolerans TaxID=3041496 RepID=UPI0024E0747F|nr:AlpA family phage regulatory protein [Comamonas sp. NoAH]
MTPKKNAPAIPSDSQSAVAAPILVTPPQEAKSHHLPDRLLRIRDVCFLTGLARSTVYAKVKSDSFPAAVQLHGSCVAWRLSEVQAWIAARPLATEKEVYA